MTVPDVFVDAMAPGDLDAVLTIDALGQKAITADRLRDELVRAWAKLWVVRARADAHVHAHAHQGPDAQPQAFLLAWHVADELHILDVATHPEARRRGHGRALMGHAISFANANAVRLVLLEVRRSNAPAIALYESFGFSVATVRAAYYADGEDALEMHLSL